MSGSHSDPTPGGSGLGPTGRTATILLVLLALTVAGFLWGVSALTAPFGGSGGSGGSAGDAAGPGSGDATPACRTVRRPTGPTVRPSDVTVSVLNAGAPGGSAGSALDALVAQGFQRGSAGNSGDGQAPVTVWSAEPESLETRLVLSALPDATQAVLPPAGAPQAAGVIVVVGPGFDGELGTARSSLRATKAVRVCGDG
ncbi:LytR C-terminal domain-containing protein [Nocardioides sp. TRM66260-LWL]|uniref:LytR C-terminal domain-containing protein n=1 Tax=Nocardioides sp. TRM66260-LWL TaxID=2874478 RepID=UPI001CC4E46C|nr:LytR C-terminal domain-containing protein [Nocardioides sp. TRM66260-LWL]MBZ5736048.1 LytR C-terminal domain-containing protein [Nocardioides sp. TRM66260-LWL]